MVLRPPRRPSGSVPTSSLADIAFLLLIFFLVTTVFDEEKGIGIVLPPADTPVRVAPETVLRFLVLPGGGVDVVRGASARTQRVAVADVGRVWRAEVVDRPGLIASVETDPAAPYHRMVDVLDALTSAGAERVSLRLAEPGGR